MKLVRDIERRLENLVEGIAGRVFRGQLHPVELAARMVREADLTSENGPAGPCAPNAFTLRLNPRELSGVEVPSALTHELAAAFETAAAERGWRLAGPVVVRLDGDEEVPPGTVDCRVDTVAGRLPAWGALAGADGLRFPLEPNRVLIGRSKECDVIITDPEVSRRHALVWREGGEVWLVDLGSANGTTLDGIRVDAPVTIGPGSVVGFGPARFTFRP